MSNDVNKFNLFLKPDEAKFFSIAVVAMLKQIKEASQNTSVNWTPEARKDMREMAEAGNSLKIKLKKLGFNLEDFTELEDGEEDNYFTRQS